MATTMTQVDISEDNAEQGKKEEVAMTLSSSNHSLGGIEKDGVTNEDSTRTEPLYQSDHPVLCYADFDVDDGAMTEEEYMLLRIDQVLNLRTERRRRSKIEQLRGYLSTGTVLQESIQHPLHTHIDLSTDLSAILDPSVEVDETNIWWRSDWLNSFEEGRETIEALQVLGTSSKDFGHPLHNAKDTQVQQRPQFMSEDSEDDSMSVASTDSVWSVTTWFSATPSKKKNPLAGKRRSRGTPPKTGRRFIDLTVAGAASGDAVCFFDSPDCITPEDFEALCDDGDVDDGDSVGTSYSFPVQKVPKKKGRSHARKFLDLTVEVAGGGTIMRSVSSQRRDGGSCSMFPAFLSGSSSSLNSAAIRKEEEEDKTGKPTQTVYTNDAQDSVSGLFAGVSDEEDLSVEDGDDDETEFINSTDAWEKANAFFIEAVHDVARGLERQLNAQGIESPFWRADQIIPVFGELHVQLKDNMIRHDVQSVMLAAKANEIMNAAESDDEAEPSPATKLNATYRRMSPAMGEDGPAYRRVAPVRPPDDITGGYDDLGMRHLQRDDRTFLFSFMYNSRKDGTCSLPSSLVSGLTKDIPDQTSELALGIIENLTSPLRRHRATPVLGTVVEGDEGMDASRARRRRPRRASMSLRDMFKPSMAASTISLQPLSSSHGDVVAS